MTSDEILRLLDGLRARGVYHFECPHFTVQMAPTSVDVHEGVVTFSELGVKEHDFEETPKDPSAAWRGYDAADLGFES